MTENQTQQNEHHRVKSLELAVAIERTELVKAEDVLANAASFYKFIKEGGTSDNPVT